VHVLAALFLTAAVTVPVVMNVRGRETEPRPAWLSRRIVVVERGDGPFDVLGRSRRVADNLDDVRLILIDGRTGTPKWESQTIGSYSTTDDGFVTQSGDLVLFTYERTIQGFALADGFPRWSAKLPTQIERLCEQGDMIVAISVDGMGHSISKRDGAWTVIETSSCSPLPTDARERHLMVERDEYGILVDTELTGSVRVVAGRSNKRVGRSRGSGLATLVAVEPSGKARWRVELPEFPETAPQHPPIAITVGQAEVCAAYQARKTSRPVGITCFTATDGERMWSNWIDDWNVSSLAIAGRTLLISRSGKLEAWELDTGIPRWQFGG
jgi:hypothetical protein